MPYTVAKYQAGSSFTVAADTITPRLGRGTKIVLHIKAGCARAK